MNSGIVLATLGGMIIEKQDAGSVMSSGGTQSNPFPLGVYGMFALGWDSTNPMSLFHKAVGFQFADLRPSSSIVTLMMLGF